MTKTPFLFLCVMVLAVNILSTVTADHSPTHSRWSIDVGDEEMVIEELNFSFEGELIIPIYIDNRNQISITIQLEYTLPFNADFEGPGSIDLDGSSDQSFTVMLSGVDVQNLTAQSQEEFEVVGTVTARQGLPISVPGDSDSSMTMTTIPTIAENETEFIEPVSKEVPALSAAACLFTIAVAASRTSEQ